jgi:hypothetical protein
MKVKAVIPFRAKAPQRAFAEASVSSDLGGLINGCTIGRQEKTDTWVCVLYLGWGVKAGNCGLGVL